MLIPNVQVGVCGLDEVGVCGDLYTKLAVVYTVLHENMPEDIIDEAL